MESETKKEEVKIIDKRKINKNIEPIKKERDQIIDILSKKNINRQKTMAKD